MAADLVHEVRGHERRDVRRLPNVVADGQAERSVLVREAAWGGARPAEAGGGGAAFSPRTATRARVLCGDGGGSLFSRAHRMGSTPGASSSISSPSAPSDTHLRG